MVCLTLLIIYSLSEVSLTSILVHVYRLSNLLCTLDEKNMDCLRFFDM